MKFLASLFICAIAGVLFFISIDTEGRNIKENKACSEPLSYRIGSIDSRFDVSEEDVKKALKEASEAWSGVINNEVALYSENGEISVNLVYDDRQKFGEEELSLRKKLSAKEKQIRNLERRYNSLKEEYQKKVKIHLQRQEDFKKSLNSFNNWVKGKNDEGGMKEEDIPAYRKRKREIEYIQSQLEREKTDVNNLGNQLNDKVNELNQVIAEKNDLVDKYNRRYTGTKSFTQGTYEVRGSDKKINVFYFLNEGELKLVLAHELGHALGIGHVSDPGAVMYDHTKKQSKTMLELTSADKNALLYICGRE